MKYPEQEPIREMWDSEHLFFKRFDSETGKTFIWNVCSKWDNLCIGQIRWHGRWRQYCFFPIPDCVWSHDCLLDLSNFLVKKNDEYKAEKKDILRLTKLLVKKEDEHKFNK